MKCEKKFGIAGEYYLVTSKNKQKFTLIESGDDIYFSEFDEDRRY